ncbi:hypothetical protein [Mesorhizobium sp. CAU 1741]|uniref:hypothetical protein n=1 Tax=Mesorhizobium sp. CAU 1741 TaxID=3140366 RepID=UPI00325BF96F
MSGKGEGDSTSGAGATAEFARELSGALKGFHRALILAEAGDDPVLRNSPYSMLFALIADPRFAWMGTLSQLIAEIDQLQSDGEADDAERIRHLTDRSTNLIGEGTGADAAGFRLRHVMALQKEPEVGLATGLLRRVLAERPSTVR